MPMPKKDITNAIEHLARFGGRKILVFDLLSKLSIILPDQFEAQLLQICIDYIDYEIERCPASDVGSLETLVKQRDEGRGLLRKILQ